MEPRYKPYALALVSGVIYAAFNLIMFRSGNSNGGSYLPAAGFIVMSNAFLIFVPFSIGWFSIPAQSAEAGWITWVFLPWLPVALSDVLLLLMGREGLICIVFAIPITFFFASVGGVAAGLYHRRIRKRLASTLCIAILPFVIAFAESFHTAPRQIRPVETSLVIHAPVSTIWQNIASVRAIAPAELRPTWAHKIGFPLPIAATLDRESIGGVRKASFEGGVLFTETITDWQPDHTIAFSIRADTPSIPSTTLDEHVTIGGEYFDVLDGRYTIEPQQDGSIRLRLVSQERLSTDFNWYAGLWSDAVMRSLQQSILEVIQHRCESARD
ncbi:MAG: hypothetical protein P4L10_06470 [Acidobacteriaceae bacterium]|nr:hypothetical protein [Acidobacteriaceae bacterium]